MRIIHQNGVVDTEKYIELHGSYRFAIETKEVQDNEADNFYYTKYVKQHELYIIARPAGVFKEGVCAKLYTSRDKEDVERVKKAIIEAIGNDEGKFIIE